MCLYGTNVSTPTFVDDMTLIAFSKSAMNQILDISPPYLCKWWYFYNANKCAVLVFKDKIACILTLQVKDF